MENKKCYVLIFFNWGVTYVLPTVYDIIMLIVVQLSTYPITSTDLKVLCCQFMHKGDMMSHCTANNISILCNVQQCLCN